MPSSVPIAEVTSAPIDVNRLIEAVRAPEAGAVVVFLGTVRRVTSGRQTDSLSYEAYESMAKKELARVLAGVCEEWSVCRAAAEHRVGDLQIGDIAVVVSVSGAHRDETFAAGRALIDRVKESVPIWKQEHWSDGEIEWVDPTSAPIPVTGEASSEPGVQS